jgi:hypothetical protein
MSLRNLQKLIMLGLVYSLMPGAGRSQTPAPAAAPAAGAVQTPAAPPAAGTRVHGTITDPDGELIPGATIMLTPAKGAGRKVVSGSDGTYSIMLAPGSYTFVVSMQGFASYSALNVKVANVNGMTLDAKLQIGVENQVVNVDSDAIQLSVDADSNASSQIISGKDLEALSDDPDELQSELEALAGPSAGPNGGQIYVDGFTGGTLPPKSSIREIRINQNPFSAQYDKLGFGRIEVFTKPGTDKLHGSIQMNGNPSQFDSGNPLIPSTVYQPPYHTLFVFGNVTGPINKNASYSVGGSYRDIEDDAFTNAKIYALPATPTTLCQPDQAGCVQTTAQISSHTPQSRVEITPRIDLALGKKNVLTTRLQYTQNTEVDQGLGNLTLPTAGFNSNNNEVQLQMSDTQTYSSKLINEDRFEYQRNRTSSTPFSNAPSLSVQGVFTGGGSGGQSSSDHQDHFEVQNYTSIALKKNFIRFGGRLRSTREAENSQGGTNGSFTYSTLLTPANCVSTPNTGTCVFTDPVTGVMSTIADNSFQSGTPSQFGFTKVNNPDVNFTFTDVGLYAEDDWKVKQNLSVSYGIRYETQNHLPGDNNIAPRVSAAYGLGNGKGTPKTVLRGGFGLFYDRFGQGNVLTLARENGVNNTIYTVRNPSCTTGPNPTCCTPSMISACIGLAPTSSQTVYSTSNLHAPYIVQFQIGADRQLGKIGTLSLNYLHSQGVHQLATQNIAYNIATQVATGEQFQYFTEGVFQQNQLVLNGRVQATKRVSLFGFYQYGKVNGDTSGAGSFISTPGNIAADYGRTGFDVRQRYFMAGTVTLPKFIQFSPFMTGQSGNPYNVTTGTDNNGDSVFNDRPLIVNSSLANGSTIKTIAGCGTFAQRTAPGTAGAPIAPINVCTGPLLYTFNFRLTKTFGFGGAKNAPPPDARGQGGQGGAAPQPPQGGNQRGGGGGGARGGGGGGGGGGGAMGMGGGGGSNTSKKYNFALGINVQNLFNNKNLATPNSTLSSPQFGTSTQLTGGAYTTNSALRRLSLQASFTF